MHRLLPALLVVLVLAAPVHAQAPDTVLVNPSEPQALRGAEPPMGAPAAGTASSSPRPQAVFNVLFVFLALSLVFESAMSVLFDWRLFIRHFEGRGVKTPIIVGTAFLVFWSYDLDIIHDLLTALNQGRPEKSVMGQFLTALLIAGGSGGLFRIFARLGIRSPEERRRKAREERSASSAEGAAVSESTA